MPTTFTPYQVDHTVKNASKMIGFSKKRVSFKFGIANNEAIGQGLTGANCRGSEHEVIFVWSLNSGKRQILADGKDVHFSESGQNGWTTDQVFQHQFQIRVPNFNTPIRCHLITQPANRDIPSIHPFDLRVNGISYFAFSKIFQLGTSSMVSRSVKGSRGAPVNPEDDPYCTPEERKAIAAAKLASIRDYREQQKKSGESTALTVQSAPTRDEGNLIDFFDTPAAAPPVPAQQPNASTFVSSMTMDTTFGHPNPPPQAPAPPQQQGYSNYSLQQPPAAAYGQPPMAPQQNAFAQPPQPAAAYGGQYGQPPAMAPGYGAPQQQYYQQPQQGFAPPPGTNMLSPSNQTTVSYGSAPSFAQPPQQQQQPQQQQYNYAQQAPGFPQY